MANPSPMNVKYGANDRVQERRSSGFSGGWPLSQGFQISTRDSLKIARALMLALRRVTVAERLIAVEHLKHGNVGIQLNAVTWSKQIASHKTCSIKSKIWAKFWKSSSVPLTHNQLHIFPFSSLLTIICAGMFSSSPLTRFCTGAVVSMNCS